MTAAARAWLGAGVAGYLVAVGVNRSLRRVNGRSMEPTLAPDDRVLTMPVVRPLRRGELVVVADPARPGREAIKRVVGLPGETVELVDGQLWIDRAPHDEPYRRGDGRPAVLVAGDGHVVVLGDRRDASTDSRDWGPVELSAVRRRVVARWPRVTDRLRAAPVPRRSTVPTS